MMTSSSTTNTGAKRLIIPPTSKGNDVGNSGNTKNVTLIGRELLATSMMSTKPFTRNTKQQQSSSSSFLNSNNGNNDGATLGEMNEFAKIKQRIHDLKKNRQPATITTTNNNNNTNTSLLSEGVSNLINHTKNVKKKKNRNKKKLPSNNECTELKAQIRAETEKYLSHSSESKEDLQKLLQVMLRLNNNGDEETDFHQSTTTTTKPTKTRIKRWLTPKVSGYESDEVNSISSATVLLDDDVLLIHEMNNNAKGRSLIKKALFNNIIMTNKEM